MSGHSKWSSIKHKKGAADAKRGQLFTKLARAIQVAAREGGGDPEMNASLALAVQKAKDARMPKDNIERAIAKGTGADSSGDAIETVLYEGFGPGGVAIMVEALTDNRNRTSAEMRHLFTRNGGSMGEPGSVAWSFDKKGVVVVDASRHSEEDLVVAIDAGAEDVSVDDDVYEILSEPADLPAVRAALEEAGVDFDSAEITMRASNRVPIPDGEVGRLLRLLDDIEDHDDVSAVHANFEADPATLERASA